MNKELLQNLDKLHTTPMGVDRIRRNLGLGDDITDVVSWCKNQIESTEARIVRKGKTGIAGLATALSQ